MYSVPCVTVTVLVVTGYKRGNTERGSECECAPTERFTRLHDAKWVEYTISRPSETSSVQRYGSQSDKVRGWQVAWSANGKDFLWAVVDLKLISLAGLPLVCVLYPGHWPCLFV